MCNLTPSRRPSVSRRRSAVLFDALEPRALFTAAPTTTILTLSAPVTSANQPLILTAAVTSDPGSPAPTGTVAFFETVDLSRDPSHHYLIPDLLSFPGSSTAARLLGTATLSADGTATLSLDSIPSSSAIYTGQFRAAFLGSDSPFSLHNSTTSITPTPGQTLGPAIPDPDGTTTATYLIFPQNQPLSLHNAQLTILSDLPMGATAAALSSATFSYTDQYGNESNTTLVTDPPTPLADNHATAPYFLAASTDPVLVTITVSHVTHYAPVQDPANPGFWNYAFVPYPNLYTYTATLTSVPALAHAFDANPDFQSSLSDAGIPAVSQPTSLNLRASSSTGSLTAPPTFTVSVFNPDGTRRLSRTNPAFPSNGASTHSAQAGLIVSTGGGTSGGVINVGGGGITPPLAFRPPGPFPTGTVSFFDENNTLLATVPLDADGNASFAPDPRSLPLGSHTLHATYSGDANYLPASATSDPFTLTHTSTWTYLATSAPGVRAGETFALAATVSDYDTITPTGTITFSEGDVVLATVPLGQTSSIHLTLSAGAHTITASYAGDADCLPSSATTTVTILDAIITNPPITNPPPYNPGGYFPDPFAGTITDASPDSLIPNYPSVTFSQYAAGDTLSFDADFAYAGTGHPRVSDAPVAFYLSLDDVAGNADDIPLIAQETLYSLASLSFDDAGHATRRSSYTAVLPADLAPGTYHVVATADPYNAIAETDETNNTLVSYWTITITDPATNTPTPATTPDVVGFITPDLTGTLTPARATATPNAPASLKLTLTNPSKTKSVARKYTVTYYLSADATYSSDDVKFSKQTIAANLGKKQTKSFTLSYKLPKTAPLGTRYLIAVADTPAHTPSAHLELSSAKPIKILGPHLSPSVTSAQPLPGNRTRVAIRIANNGSGAHTGPLTLRLSSPLSTKPLLQSTRSLSIPAGKSATFTLTLAGPVPDLSAIAAVLV